MTDSSHRTGHSTTGTGYGSSASPIAPTGSIGYGAGDIDRSVWLNLPVWPFLLLLVTDTTNMFQLMVMVIRQQPVPSMFLPINGSTLLIIT